MSDLHTPYPFGGNLPVKKGKAAPVAQLPSMTDPAPDHLAHIHQIDPVAAAERQRHAGQYADYRAANAAGAKSAHRLKK